MILYKNKCNGNLKLRIPTYIILDQKFCPKKHLINPKDLLLILNVLIDFAQNVLFELFD